MIRLVLVFTFFMFAGCVGTSHAGNVDLLWNGSKVQGVKSYTAGIDFSDTMADKFEISGYYRKGKTEGIVTSDEGELSLGYDPPINDRWSLWLDERVGYNKMLNIDFENSIGFGAKYYLYKAGNTKLSLSSGVLYQFTSSNCSDPSLCEQEGRGRYSHRIKFGSKIFNAVYFYQPNIDNSDDYISKFTGDIELIKIMDRASILIHHKNEYRSLSGRSESSGIKLRIEY